MTTHTQIIRIFVDHERSSDDICFCSSEFDKIIIHHKLGNTLRIKPDITQITDMSLLRSWTTMFLSIWIEVTTGTHTPVRKITRLMDVNTMCTILEFVRFQHSFDYNFITLLSKFDFSLDVWMIEKCCGNNHLVFTGILYLANCIFSIM